MRSFIPALAFFLLCATPSLSQHTDSFDLATYTAPANWKKTGDKPDAVAYAITNNSNNTWAQIILYKSMATMGNPQLDFDTDWKDLVMNTYKTGAATPVANNSSDGWQIISGSSTFDFNGTEAAIAMVTWSGYGIRMSALIQTNTDAFQPDMESFMGSIALTKPAVNTTTVNATTATTTNNNTSSPFPGMWGMASSEQSAYLVNNGMSGYIKRQYTFNADGTYRFVMKTFRMYLSSIYLTVEEGTYTVSGNNISVKPSKRVVEEWSKKDNADGWGNLLKSQQGTLESATYHFSKNYFSGIDETSLVLTTNTPTERDGPFNGGSAFSNAYLYGPISNRNPVVELPARR